MKKRIKIFDSKNALSNFFAEYLLAEINSSNNFFTISLSGGSTPKMIFNHLAKNYVKKIDWEKVKFFWGDERCVPPASDESNYKMAWDSLLSKIKADDKNIFRIKGEADPFEEADRYAEVLKENIRTGNNFPKFDLVMLGLGEDGHTASIFPNQMNLIADKKLTAVAVHPVSRGRRITLTPALINNAKKIFFVVTGKRKSKIVYEILTKKNDSINYPAELIDPAYGELFWALDKEAANLLT